MEAADPTPSPVRRLPRDVGLLQRHAIRRRPAPGVPQLLAPRQEPWVLRPRALGERQGQRGQRHPRCRRRGRAPGGVTTMRASARRKCAPFARGLAPRALPGPLPQRLRRLWSFQTAKTVAPGPCRASLGGTTSLRSLTARWTFSSFSATRVLFVPFRDRPRHLLAQNQSGPSVAGTRRRA